MKKYILLLVTALSFAQASNQMVTFTQAQSLGFSLNSGQSHITSNQCITKSEALAKYNLDANAMSSYASNQLVPKSVWISGVSYFTYNFHYNVGEICLANADVETNPLVVVYSTSSAIVTGMVFYTNTSLTATLNGSNRSQSYFSQSTNQQLYINNVGVLTIINHCQ